MGAPRHHVLDDPEIWLGVQEASDLLGVSPATLRRWSAAGKVRAFTTPGGHRRFAESTIRQLLGSATGGSGPTGATGADPSVHALGESTDRVARLVRQRLDNGSAGCVGLSWLSDVSPDERELLAEAGRVMVEGLLAHVDGRSHTECELAIAPALEAAALHGRLAALHQGGLAETVEAFHRLRGLLVDDLSDLVCRRGLATPQATRILARVNDAVDRLVGALVEAYAAALRPGVAAR